MAVAIGVNVRFLARLRELAGAGAEQLEMRPGSTVAEVYARARGAHPSLPPQETVRAAVNLEFADWDVPVAAGDEVAFIPPVSGGR